jgi:uncharacterized protein (TIGR02246 family)
MRIPKSLPLLLTSILAVHEPSIRAQDRARPPAAESAVNEDEQAIRKTAAAFETAYRAKDFEAIARQYTPEGEIIDAEGNVVRGRAAIADGFQRIFAAQPEGRLTISIHSIRLVAPGVAIEDGTTRLVRARNQPALHGRYAAVHVKLDGQWLVASTRDLVPNSEVIPISERLKPLEFLIGDWVDEGEESIVAASYRWGEDRKSLTHEFTVKRAGAPVLKGTQRIGWDPLRRTIMSWTFDSAGGHGEGVWTWDHDHWIIKLTGVGAMGAPSSATVILTPRGHDSYRWEAKNRVMGGEALPDMTVRIVRKPPEPHENETVKPPPKSATSAK